MWTNRRTAKKFTYTCWPETSRKCMETISLPKTELLKKLRTNSTEEKLDRRTIYPEQDVVPYWNIWLRRTRFLQLPVVQTNANKTSRKRIQFVLPISTRAFISVGTAPSFVCESNSGPAKEGMAMVWQWQQRQGDSDELLSLACAAKKAQNIHRALPDSVLWSDEVRKLFSYLLKRREKPEMSKKNSNCPSPFLSQDRIQNCTTF